MSTETQLAAPDIAPNSQDQFPAETMEYVRSWLCRNLSLRYTPTRRMCISTLTGERQTWSDILSSLIDMDIVCDANIEVVRGGGGRTHTHLRGTFGVVHEWGDNLNLSISRALVIAICKLPAESKPLFTEGGAE